MRDLLIGNLISIRGMKNGKYCPQCGAPNQDDAKFCIRCDYKFSQEEKYFSIEIINRENTKKHFYEGNRLSHLGKYAEAVEEYDKTLAIDPNFKEAHYNKGLSLQNLKRYEEAIEEYDKTLAIDPYYTDANYSKNLIIKYKKWSKKIN